MPQETFSLSSFTKTSADLKRNATFTAYASGGGFPAFAVADSVTLYLSSIKTYSSSGRLSVSLGGASGSCSLPQNSSVHSATLSLSLDGGNWASLSDGTATFTVLGGASTSTNIINLRSGITGSLTVNYHINMTECKPPTSVTLDATLVNAGTSTTLRWSGASAGTNNPIGAYVIYRSSNGGSSYSELATVGATVSSYTVTAPSTMGASYVYKVAVVSGMEGVVTMSTATATLTAKTYTACSAPTTVTISASSVAPGASVTLSWSGAKAGTNNAISGYHVYRATSAGGTYAHITSVTTTAASGSTAVTAPTSNGSSYYYKVYTLGAAGYNSGASSVYATLICSYSAPSAPPSVSIGGGASAYALSGATVTLAWSGAGAGTNNPITGYDIYQNGTIYVQGLSAGTTSHAVAAHTAAGSSYTYTVVTRGAYSNSGASAGRVVYTYSHPIAPTAVSVSNSTPDAGTSVTLSWSGAEAGSYNVIARYKVYRADTPSGEYTELTSVDSTATSGSCSVTAPGTMGSSFYYKVVTVGVRSVSGQSSAYAAVTAQTYSACTAPSTVTLSKTSDAIPGETVTLSWSGAAAGMHNPISGYQVYCQLDGQAAVLLDTLSASVSSLPVTASNTLGGSAAYYLILSLIHI